MLRNLPMELLRCFVTVIEQKGFSRAGEVLSLSQPAVSLRIKRLEDLVERTLLVRGNRELKPTPAGEQLLDYARRIVRLNDQAISALLTPSLTGTVRLGIPNEFAVSYLPRILGDFSRRYPNLTLEVTCDLSTHLLTRLQHRDLDLCVAIHKGEVDAALEPWSEQLCWVAAKNYSPNPHKAVPLVVAPSGCVYRHRAQTALRRAGVQTRIAYTGTSYNGIRAAVAAGLGITALARSAVPDDLKIVDQDFDLPALAPASIAIHVDNDHSADETRLLIDYIRGAFNN